MVGLQQGPAFQDVAGRDPALRQPTLGQQRPEVPAVGLVGLGVPFAAAGEGGVRRLGQMRRDAGRGQLLGDIPPPGAPLDRERDVLAAVEPRQPGPQVLPVRRADLAAPHLPGAGVEIVEGDLLPVDIQPAYDGHSGPPQAPEGRTRPLRIAYAVNPDARLSWGGLPAPGRRPQLSPARCMSSNRAGSVPPGAVACNAQIRVICANVAQVRQDADARDPCAESRWPRSLPALGAEAILAAQGSRSRAARRIFRFEAVNWLACSGG